MNLHRSFLRSLFPVAAACWLTAVCGCRPSTASRAAGNEPSNGRGPLDVVLVTIDTLRSDALGYSGNRRVRTPNLDRLAAEGAVFTQAHAHNVVTLPSHANILTGLYPYQNGVRDNDGFRLDASIPTVATLLKEKGYATAAFIGAFPLDARFGLARGFDRYDQGYPQGAHEYDFSVAERPAEEVLSAAKTWFAGAAADGRPRFLWVHLYDCHAPHVPPPALRDEFRDVPYLGEVTGVDGALEPFLSDLRVSTRRTLLVVTSDHGEALGDHGEETHGLFAYESTLHVPLIVWSPALVRPRTDPSNARHVDILPTVLEAAGVPAPARLPGRSLLSRGIPAETPSYFEALSASYSRGWAPLRGVVGKGLKFIDLPVPELYDLAADRSETDNLVDRRRDDVRALANALPPKSQNVPAEPSAENLGKLRSLGYLTGRAALRERYGPEDDPKNLKAMDAEIQSVIHHYQHGKIAEAVSVARNLIRERPSMPIVYEFLSFLEAQTGHTAAAISVLEAAKARGFLTENLASRLALLHGERGEFRPALALLEPLAGSRNPDVLNALGIVRASSGDVPGAIKAFESALRADSGNAVAWQNIGLTWVQRGRSAQALQAFEKAFAINDRLPRAWNGRGVALEQLGRHREALDAWRRAVELDPQQYEALLNAGVVAGQIGEADVSRRALTRFVSTAPPALFQRDIATARRLLTSLRAPAS
ncbi:MAG: sulfatase-like hydrolase/transferase [Acidobacteriota bacterium]|nr:sulfatase-like hydrolase/transferase [Acidobacteriota bacterium]